MKSFTATVDIIGINPYVTPPEPVLKSIFDAAGKSAGPVPVLGRIDGHDFSQTLVKYSGAWRLYINGPMLKAAKAKVGNQVSIELWYDSKSREEPMNPQLEAALIKNPKAAAEFAALAPYRRKEILRYLNHLKSSEAVSRNVARVVAHLSDEETDGLYAMMRRKKT